MISAKPHEKTAEGSVKLKTDSLPSFWSLILPYWTSEEKWLSGLIVITIISCGYINIYFEVWRNSWTGHFYDAIGAAKFIQLSPLMVQFLGIVTVSSCLAIFASVLQSGLIIRWRTWMTRRFAAGWMANRSYYRIERDQELDNADQRIAEDIKLFVDNTVSLFFNVLQVPVSAVTFSIVLWRLTGALRFHWHGALIVIPGYMVLTTYLFSGGTLLITHLIGRRLIHLNVLQQKREADFRVLMVQIRESAEQIAFYRGESTEVGRLGQAFEAVRQNTWGIIRVQCKTQFATNIYGQIGYILPTLLVLPQLLAGQLNLGGLMRVSAAFGSVNSTLSFFPQVYQQFALWRANTQRLRQLLAAETETEAPGITAIFSADGAVAADGLILRSAADMPLAIIPPFHLMPGDRCLIRGRSGAGKSTLLRALAGLWPYGNGTVSMPHTSRTMFVPQKSYAPDGSLKQALAYPAGPDAYDDRNCLDALTRCGLNRYCDALHLEDRWRQRLSGGEQQRLAFARILLQRPAYLFLDEATSALDAPAEAMLYQTIVEQLPGLTLVSVAHREAVAKFHNRELDLSKLIPHDSGTHHEPAFQ